MSKKKTTVDETAEQPEDGPPETAEETESVGQAAPDEVAEAEAADQGAITLGVFALEVVQKPTTTTDHLQQTLTGMMIVNVRLEVFGEGPDPFGKQGNLDFSRPGVGVASLVFTDYFSFAINAEAHELRFSLGCHKRRDINHSL